MQKISATNERRQNYRKYKGFENNPLYKKDSNFKTRFFFLIENRNKKYKQNFYILYKGNIIPVA